jgi:hypothetical protein
MLSPYGMRLRKGWFIKVAALVPGVLARSGKRGKAQAKYVSFLLVPLLGDQTALRILPQRH